MSLYQGFSPQKTMARSTAYSQIPRSKFYSGKHVVIASRECGDIRWLLDCGISPSNIIACDLDYAAIQAARKFRVRISPHESIEATAEWALRTFGKEVASINVDLCVSLKYGIPPLRTVLEHRFRSERKFPVFYTFMRGRRDGMTNDGARHVRLVFGVGNAIRLWIPYTSFTQESQGSPMCMTVF